MREELELGEELARGMHDDFELAGAKMLLPAKMRKPLPIAATSVRDIRARHGSGGEDRGAELGMQHRDRRDAERRVASCGIWSR